LLFPSFTTSAAANTNGIVQGLASEPVVDSTRLIPDQAEAVVGADGSQQTILLEEQKAHDTADTDSVNSNNDLPSSSQPSLRTATTELGRKDFHRQIKHDGMRKRIELSVEPHAVLHDGDTTLDLLTTAPQQPVEDEEERRLLRLSKRPHSVVHDADGTLDLINTVPPTVIEEEEEKHVLTLSKRPHKVDAKFMEDTI
jgi:hypothetical protein